MDKARKLAGEVLTRITKDGAFSGAALDEALSSQELTAQDRAFVTELVYGTLSRLWSIDEIIRLYSKVRIRKMEDAVLSSLRIAIYQIKYLDRVPPFAAVDEAVTIVRRKSPRGAGLVNGILRSILRDEKEMKHSSELERLSFQYSLKPELTGHFLAEYPKDAEAILKGSLAPEGLSIRINRNKISPADYRLKLEEAGIGYRPGWFSPLFLTLERQGAVRDLPGFTEGWFSVQNEAAALPPLILSELVEKGQVLDLCAAPGGKSALMKELKGKDLAVTAFDLSTAKLQRMDENFRRLGLEIRTRAQDATAFLPELEEQADGVLLDVPCSGLGLLGRKPDIRQNMDLKGMEELAATQAAILDNGARYVKPGGFLIYSTCTLDRRENEDNVQRFLARHPDFKVLTGPAGKLLETQEKAGLDQLRVRDGLITVLPGQGLDGFFIAVLARARQVP